MFNRRVSTEKYADLLQQHQDLKDKYDIEVAAHRANCISLDREMVERIELGRQLNQVTGELADYKLLAMRMAEGFMSLHDVAKTIVGPKPTVG